MLCDGGASHSFVCCGWTVMLCLIAVAKLQVAPTRSAIEANLDAKKVS